MLEALISFLGHAVVELVVNVLVIGIGYWPGWLILRVLTLGRYPPPGPERHNAEFVGAVPYVVLLILITFVYS